MPVNDAIICQIAIFANVNSNAATSVSTIDSSIVICESVDLKRARSAVVENFSNFNHWFGVKYFTTHSFFVNS